MHVPCLTLLTLNDALSRPLPSVGYLAAIALWFFGLVVALRGFPRPDEKQRGPHPPPSPLPPSLGPVIVPATHLAK